MQTGDSLLIVARPNRWLEALRVLLLTLPRLQVIGQANDVPAALEIVRAQAPSLVLVDASLSEAEVKTLLSQVKTQRPATRCIVLADTIQRQRMAWAAGADAALLKGASTASLLAAMA